MTGSRWPHRVRSRRVATSAEPRNLTESKRIRAEVDDMVNMLIPPGTREIRFDEVFARVQELHGRPITLRPVEKLPASFTCGGLFVATTGPADFIVYPAGDGIRSRTIVWHEIGHVVFKDGDEDATLAVLHMLMPNLPIDLLRTLLPDLPLDQLTTVRARTTFVAPQEKRTETFSTNINARLTDLAPYQRDPLTTDRQRRFGAGFGVPQAPVTGKVIDTGAPGPRG